jgi:hypothetical protein
MESIPSPKDYLGFEVGEDRKLADWPQIVGYFQILGCASERVRIEEIGKSTEGNPFLLAMVSSPANLAELERYRDIQARLADPRTIVSDRDAEELIAAGRVVVVVTCSIHAIEAGASQMSMLLGHHLCASENERVRRILDNVIFLLVPCLNPDGLILVKRWYDSTLGTPHEGVSPPSLYHKYAGHDNNRDWFMFTQAETRLVVERCLNAWHPQIVYDLHQTRATGMRMVLPPYVDPIGPNVDPVLQSEAAMLGAAIASELTAQGKAGVAMNVIYDAYSPSRCYQHYHGGIRILSEVADVRIASPIDVTQEHLKSARGEDPTQATWNHPMPWRGGRWSLQDIVEYEFAAVMACLDHAARYRDAWVRNFYEVGRRAVSTVGNPYAFLVPQKQRDPIAASELLQVMRTAAVEVHEARHPFVADGANYPEGTRVILTRQPYGAFAATMMEAQQYPDLRQYPGGPPRAPYDVTAHSLPIQMGVDVVEVKSPFAARLELLESIVPAAGQVIGPRAEKAEAYLLRPDSNASARAVNRLLAAGACVGWAREQFRAEGGHYPSGTFIVQGDAGGLVSAIAKDESLTFDAISSTPGGRKYQLRAPRVGIYKSYVPTPEEGWTRFVFEQYCFPFVSLADGDIRQGGLADRFDAILIPNQHPRNIHHGHDRAHYAPEYAGGLGEAGAASLRDFVERGGTLIGWDGGARWAIQHLSLPVHNSLAGLSHSEFFAPGSLLRVLLDTQHPIAYGMPEKAAVMFLHSPAFDARQGRVIARYPTHNPLLSGWLVGAEKLQGKAALVTVPLGKGEVVLMGFRVHFRAQSRGTYKLLFNSLYYSAAV